MYCTNCGRQIPDGVKFCGYCGAPVELPKPKKKKKWPWVLLTVCICVCIIGAGGWFGLQWLEARQDTVEVGEDYQNENTSPTLEAIEAADATSEDDTEEPEETLATQDDAEPQETLSEAPPEPVPEAYVQDAFTYVDSQDYGDVVYHIPEIVIEGVPTESVNAQIWNEYYEGTLLEYGTTNLSTQSYALVDTITYDWGICGDILSVLIASRWDGMIYGYTAYSISISTGEMVSTDDIVAQAGLTSEEYRLLMEETIYNNYMEYFSVGGSEGLELTLSEYIIYAETFFNENGELCIIAPIVTMAGAEYYEFLMNLETQEIYGEQCEIFGITT